MTPAWVQASGLNRLPIVRLSQSVVWRLEKAAPEGAALTRQKRPGLLASTWFA